MWTLRVRFAESPAVLGGMLRCCSLVPGALLLLQQCNLPGEWNDLVIPPRVLSGETNAYAQIRKLFQEFVPKYNELIDSLLRPLDLYRQKMNTITKGDDLTVITVPVSEMQPRSIIQYTHMERILQGAVFQGPLFGSMEAFINSLFDMSFPLCKFELPKGKEDLFGFSVDDWKVAFSFAPGLKKPLLLMKASVFLVEHLDHPDSHDARYGLLGVILALYGPEHSGDFAPNLEANCRYFMPLSTRDQAKIKLVRCPKGVICRDMLTLLPSGLRKALEN
jgi:hypothetical protein